MSAKLSGHTSSPLRSLALLSPFFSLLLPSQLLSLRTLFSVSSLTFSPHPSSPVTFSLPSCYIHHGQIIMGQAFLVQAPHDCGRRGTGDSMRPATPDANLGSFQLLLRHRRAEHGQSMRHFLHWLCCSAVSLSTMGYAERTLLIGSEA